MNAHVPLSLAALFAAFSGFSALSLAMDRHWEDAFGRGRSPGRWRPWLQVAGSVALVISLLLSIVLKGSTQGWVLWLGVMTAGALAVILVASYAPRQAVRSALVASGALVVTAVIGALIA